MADLLLELLEQVLLGLGGRHARGPLELAHEVLALEGDLPLAGRELLRLALDGRQARVERILAADQALLLAADLRAARQRLVVVARRRLDRLRVGLSRVPAGRPPGMRFASSSAATTRPAARPKATTTAAITISISVSSPPPRRTQPPDVSP